MMCRRECLAGEPCDRRAACEQAEDYYGPLIRARELEAALRRSRTLSDYCIECLRRSPEACRACDMPRQMDAVHAKIIRLREALRADLQAANDRLLDLQITCRDCSAASTWESSDCAECGVRKERERWEAKVERLREEVQEGE